MGRVTTQRHLSELLSLSRLHRSTSHSQHTYDYQILAARSKRICGILPPRNRNFCSQVRVVTISETLHTGDAGISRSSTERPTPLHRAQLCQYVMRRLYEARSATLQALLSTVQRRSRGKRTLSSSEHSFTLKAFNASPLKSRSLSSVSSKSIQPPPHAAPTHAPRSFRGACE